MHHDRLHRRRHHHHHHHHHHYLVIVQKAQARPQYQSSSLSTHALDGH